MQIQTSFDPATTLPRLLRGISLSRSSYSDHLRTHGPLSFDPVTLLAITQEAGLRGLGGSFFPTANKIAAVNTARGRAIVVANGCESEPLSHKDKTLLRHCPHLVLDGALAAARSVDAQEVVLAIEEGDAESIRLCRMALRERGDEGVSFSLFMAAKKFLSGQETALISQINGGAAKPTFIPPRPTSSGVRARPTLVQNVETLANLALIARHGSAYFRALGTDKEPGSKLITLVGAVKFPGVYEIAFGTPLAQLLKAAGGLTDELAGLVFGGYFGSWMEAEVANDLVLSTNDLSSRDAALGCGIIVAVPQSSCVVAETVRTALYLASETAHQCGPCVHGTAAIAQTLHEIGEGQASQSAFADLSRWLLELPGRGACHHPNGLAHFVSTALRTFPQTFREHAANGPCRACDHPPLLVPA
jgi:NADH:ubiquinone oxidoreductase subunit F (NADH-binding)